MVPATSPTTPSAGSRNLKLKGTSSLEN